MLPKIILALLILATCCTASEMWKSEWVYYDKNGKLVYKKDALGNRIPDFGKVGYKKGLAPPVVPVVLVLSPTPGDSTQRIQDAITQVAKLPMQKNGFRGTILLMRGCHEITKPIRLNQSGIVLRGEGKGAGGTQIFVTSKKGITAISLGGGRKPREVKGSRVKITNAYVPVGTNQISLESIAGYKVGDSIRLIRPATEKWIHDLRMDQIPTRSGGESITQWSPENYGTHADRVIEKIDGKTITIDQSVVMEISDSYGGGYVCRLGKDQRVRNSAVESMMLMSHFDTTVKAKHKNEDYYSDGNHAMKGIVINSAVDCWVRNITTKYFGYAAVSIGGGATYISVFQCRYEAPVSVIVGGQRYAFEINGQLSLVYDCEADKARHSFVTSPRVSGPNVFAKCRATNAYADCGPHQRWAMGFLYDQVEAVNGAINVIDRGSHGSGHGWAGVNHVLWNCQTRSIGVHSPWVTGKNYVIASEGRASPPRYSKGSPSAIWEKADRRPLEIESLYMAQHKEWLSLSRK